MSKLAIIVAVVIVVSHHKVTAKCKDNNLAEFDKKLSKTNCSVYISNFPQDCNGWDSVCCVSCNRLRKSRPNAKSNCRWGNRVDLFIKADGMKQNCSYVAKRNNILCSKRYIKKGCCDTCVTKYGECNDLSGIIADLRGKYKCKDAMLFPPSCLLLQVKQHCCRSCKAAGW